MVQWTGRHFDPIYRRIGTDAELVPTVGDPVELRVVDKTRATVVSEGAGVDVHTQTAHVRVRKSELDEKEIDLEHLDKGTITFHGATWTIDSHVHDSPDGPGTGEVFLFLIEGGDES